MKTIKTTLGWAAFAVFVLVFLNGNRMLTHRAHASDRAEVRENLRGFAGYAFGSGDLYILEQLKADSREPIEITGDSIWLEGEFAGLRCQYGYVIQNGQLVGGALLFHDRTEEAFNEVSEFLHDTYGGRIEVTVDGAVTVQVHQGPDALILHTLDRDALTHEIAYMEIE